MSLSDYFFSARGRITRSEYWIGMVALIALSTILLVIAVLPMIRKRRDEVFVE